MDSQHCLINVFYRYCNTIFFLVYLFSLLSQHKQNGTIGGTHHKQHFFQRTFLAQSLWHSPERQIDFLETANLSVLLIFHYFLDSVFTDRFFFLFDEL